MSERSNNLQRGWSETGTLPFSEWRFELIQCPAIEAMRKAMLARSRLLWLDYEGLKANWLATHPNATPDEVAAACRAIADKLGL